MTRHWLLALAALFLLGCLNSSDKPALNFFHGTVTDLDGQPIAGATVNLHDPSAGLEHVVMTTTTDRQGRYELPDHREATREHAGSLLLAASAPGFATAVEPGHRNPEVDQSEIDLELTEGKTFSGRVVDWNGDPVPHAQVLFHRTTLSLSEADESGRFHTSAMALGRTPRVAVATPDFPFEDCGPQTLSEEEIVIQLRERIGVVEGTVLDVITTQPVSGERVALGDRVSGYRSWTTQTDERGRFRFDQVPLETWEVSLPNLEPHHRQRTASLGDQRPEVDMVIPRGNPITASGIMVDRATAEPVANWEASPRISTYMVEGNPLRTDSEGRFQVDGIFVSPGIYPLIGGHTRASESPLILHPFFGEEEWFRHQWEYLMTCATDLDAAQSLLIEVEREEPTEIVALSPDCDPLEGVQFDIVPRIPIYHELQPTNSDGLTDTGWKPRAEQWQLIGSHPDYPVVISPVMEGVQESVEARGYEGGGHLRVTVLNPDGEAVRTSTVWATPFPDQVAHHHHYNSPLRQDAVTSDRNGVGVFNNLVRGPVEISANAPNHVWGSRTIDLSQMPPSAEVTIQCVSPESASVRLLNIAGNHIPNVDDDGTLVDTDGWFEFPLRRQTGHHSVNVERGGYASRTLNVDPSDPTSNSITLLPAITVHGEVRNLDGSPPPRLEMSLWLPELGPHPWLCVASEDVNQRPGGFNPNTVRQFGFGASPFEGQSNFFQAEPLEKRVRAKQFIEPADTSVRYTTGDGQEFFELTDQEQVHTGSPTDPMGFTWRPHITSRLDHALLAASSEELLMVTNASGESATTTFTLGPDPNQRIDLGRITLVPTCEIRGRVTDRAGQPIAGLRVEVASDYSYTNERPGSFPIAWTTSAGDGRFAFSDFPAGPWQVAVTAQGNRCQVFDIDLPSDDEYHFVFNPREADIFPGTMHLTLRDENGDPLRGQAASITESDRSAWQIHHRPADANGEVFYHSVSAGPRWVRMEWRGHFSRTAALIPFEMPVNDSFAMTIDASTWPQLTVNAEPGRPVIVEHSEGDAEASALTDDNGQHVFHLPTGVYTIICGGEERETLLGEDKVVVFVD